MVLSAIPNGMHAFAAANAAAAETISAAGSADSMANLAAAAAALGPIGAPFLLAYAPAQANNLAAVSQLGAVHAAIAAATDAAATAFVARDNG
nr:type VII secretion target [Mycolicibacterium smegmatis]